MDQDSLFFKRDVFHQSRLVSFCLCVCVCMYVIDDITFSESTSDQISQANADILSSISPEYYITKPSQRKYPRLAPSVYPNQNQHSINPQRQSSHFHL